MTLGEIFRRWQPPVVPRAILVGIVLSLGAMAWLGRRAAHENYHHNFVRFTPWTAPDTKYYPTINELLTIVRNRVKPHQILVVVGGNSVLLGVGQPPAHIWTKRLQEELGDGYCVVNLAFRGAVPTDGGALAAEALRREFPRQIYIANSGPLAEIPPTGSPVYRFMFWDAYYKGLLIDDPVRNGAIQAANRAHPPVDGLLELRIRNVLDGLFYFQDLWNYVAYTHVSTVWDAYFPGAVGFSAPLQFTRPRQEFPDPEPDYLTVGVSLRFPSSRTERELQTVRDFSQHAYESAKTPEGKWTPVPAVWARSRDVMATAFPQELKKRTLMLTGHASPYYVRRLTPDEQERDGLAYAETVREWERAGYSAIEYGGDFTVDDYGDDLHLTWHGGYKLAGVVALKVRRMSTELGYLKP